MTQKNNYYGDGTTTHDNYDTKDHYGKNNLNRFDYDLFDEEKNVVEKVIRVKRTQLPNKGDRWRIVQDTKTIFIVEGSKLSKKEREYLKTSDGFSFLIAQGKAGIKSLNSLRKELKKKLK